MSKFTNPLDNIKIASPCSMDWDAMIGVGRKRYCGECKLNVYNLSGMTRREAESLLMNSEGRLCVRFYRRQDGSILTQDCPVGWQAVKQRLSRVATAFVSLVFAALSGIGLANYFAKSETENHTVGMIAPKIENPTTGRIAVDEDFDTNVEEKPIVIMGGISKEEFTKQKVSKIDKIKRKIIKENSR